MKTCTRALGLAILCSLVTLALGCGSSSTGGSGEADVKLIIDQCPGEPIWTYSDVEAPYRDSLCLVFKNELKAPLPGGAGGLPGVPDIYTDLRLEKICVRYTAFDGGNVQYVDVPASFCDVNGTLIDTLEEQQIIDVTMVHASAKAQPPLNRTSGDPLPINAIAHLCGFGHQINGDPVEGCVDLYVRFCYGQDCETEPPSGP